MKKLKRVFAIVFVLAAVMAFMVQPAFALEESEVQAQVDAVGKEAVTGNILIWFLCAVAFLKISQKIDSFMSSLGINVGHTGGSMLSEAMIAARSLGGVMRGSGGSRGGGGSGSSGGGGSGNSFLSGGLAGVVSRQVTSSAARTATGSDCGSGGIGGRMYASSVAQGGSFANQVIGSVAHGNVASMGTIQAAEPWRL